MIRGCWGLLLSTCLAACTHDARSPTVEGFELITTSGARWDLKENVAKADFTVIEFFSAECPVQKAHDARLVELYKQYSSRGVAFVAVDAEVDASPENDENEKRTRGYPFSILIDKNGRFADWIRASYSTFIVIVDRHARIRYEGGIDSDRVALTTNATFYLSDALDDLLNGKAPRRPVGKVYGCMLRKW
jgi:hypothetical protein